MTENHSAGEIITEPERILRFLGQLQRQQALLTLSLKGTSEFFTTTLAAVDHEQQRLLIDEPLPRESYFPIQEAGRAHFITEVEGTRLEFRCDWQDYQSLSGETLYRFQFPSRLVYNQRRLDYRARLGYDMEGRVLLPLPNGQNIEGRLTDLSLGGLGIEAPEAPLLSIGTHIEDCQVDLPEAPYTLECDLEIRFMQHEQTRPQVRIGVAFIGLDGRQQQLVMRTVAQLQRTMLRRQAKAAP